MMSDPGYPGSDPAGRPSGPQPQGQAQGPAPQDQGVYDVAEPAVEPGSGGATDQTAAVWYAATAGGGREGPLSPAQIKQRIAAGSVTGQTLVWKEGMSNWAPAQTVPELFARQPGMPPMPPAMAARRRAGFADFMRTVDNLFSSPAFFRLTGRVCAVLAILVLVVSLILLLMEDRPTWFTGALVFALMFFVGEAAGAVLQALGRLNAQSSKQSESGEADR